MKAVRKSFVILGLGLVALTGCVGARADEKIHFLQQNQTDGSQMEALWEGKLVVSERCLRVQDIRTSYAVIWPLEFDFSTLSGKVDILDGDDQVVAQVGDQVRVSGGELPGISPEEIEQLAPGGSRCSDPYWLAGYEVVVLTP